MSVERIKSTLLAAREAVDGLLNNEAALLKIEDASRFLIQTLTIKGSIFACGNYSENYEENV